jgi:hypothetical protein
MSFKILQEYENLIIIIMLRFYTLAIVEKVNIKVAHNVIV